MSERYKFIQHKQCEFFPCHKGVDEDKFNCLFCYCPLYALKDKCGGNFTYHNDIKDCTHCLIPHHKDNYENVVDKLSEVVEISKKH